MNIKNPIANFCKKNIIIIQVCFIIFITTFAFFPSINNGITNWDDNILLIENKNIHNLSIHNLINIFSSFSLNHYHPLVLLSFALEYHFFKQNYAIYHITNLILHLLNTILVFVFIFLICDDVFISFIAALLFGIHPLHVESVAWITERKDVLYSLFFLTSMITYLLFKKGRIKKYYYLSLIFFILSLLSKAMAVTLPIILFLLDYSLHLKLSPKNLIEKIPIFILSIIFGIIAIIAQYPNNGMDNKSFNFFQNVLIANFDIFFYLTKIIVPVNLSCFYPYPEKIGNLLPPIFLISPILTLILIIILYKTKNSSRKMFFGGLFFLITILPVIQFIPVGQAMAADRFTYIPIIGFFYLLAEFVNQLYLKSFSNKKLTSLFYLTLIFIFGFLSFLTYERCKIWKNSFTLWSDVIRKYPDVPIGYISLGSAYYDSGKYNKAIDNYTTAINKDPKNPKTYVNRANAYSALNLFDKAIYDYGTALKLNSKYPKAYNDRGNVFLKIGDYEKALSDFTQALIYDPDYIRAFINRGNFYLSIKDYNNAIFDYSEALKLEDDNPEFYCNRALAYSAQGQYDKALSDYEQALKISPDFASAYNNRGNMWKALKKYDIAILDFTKAIEINSNYLEAHYNRAGVYFNIKEYTKAINDYTRVIEINPQFANAYINRGKTFYSLGEYQKAISDFNVAIKINPDSKEAYYMRALIYKTINDTEKAKDDIKKLEDLGVQIDKNLLN